MVVVNFFDLFVVVVVVVAHWLEYSYEKECNYGIQRKYTVNEMVQSTHIQTHANTQTQQLLHMASYWGQTNTRPTVLVKRKGQPSNKL